MREFQLAVEIATPAERVWQVMSDTDRWHEWTSSVTSIRRLDNRPFAIGSRVMIRQPKFPPALWKITAIEPGRSFTWVSVAPLLRVVAHHQVQPAQGGSRATLSISYHGLLGALLARLTQAITRRYLAFEADGLKARSEDPSFRHSG